MKKVLALFISAMLIAVFCASCGQSTSSASNVSKTSSSMSLANSNTPAPVNKDTAFVGGWPYSTVPTGHFNMFVANAIELKYYRELHQLPLATYVKATDEYQPLLATKWEISQENNTFSVSLKSDAKWHSGDMFTSKDVWTTFMIYRLVGNPVWNYIDSVTADSDTEITFGIKTPTPLILRYVLRKPIVDYKTYGEYAEKVDKLLNAGKDDKSSEWQSLATEFSNFRPEYVNATGPFYLDPANVTESSVELLKNENSFLAQTVNFGKIIVYNGDVAALTPLVLNGEVDFLTHQFPAASMETFEGIGYSTLQVDGVDGIAIYFNQAVAPLAIKEVRQAIAYVVDRAKLGELALPGVTQGTKFVTGLGDVMAEQWVDTSKLIDYNVDKDKAAQLLTQAGMSQKDGQWHLADGKQFTLSLQCPSAWSDASTAAGEIAQQLSSFGIKTTFDGIDATMRQTNIDEGKFELALSFFGTGQPHPMFAFETPLLVSNLNASKGLGYSMIQNTENFGTVNLEELITASTAGWDLDVQKEAVNKIAGTVNETLPILPLYTKYSRYVTSNGFRTDWGSDETLIKNSAGDDNFVVIKILRGELKPIS